MKKITKTLLIAILGLGVAGCNLNNNSNDTSSDVSVTNPIPEEVQTILGKIVLAENKTEVMNNFVVPSKVIVSGTTYDISWTADKTNVYFETVGNDLVAKLVQPEKGEEKVVVNLTASITHNSTTYTKAFRVTVLPKSGTEDVLFAEPTGTVMSWSEYRNAAQGDTVTIQGRVIAYTYDGSYGNGNLFLQDEDGGYYAYRLKASAAEYEKYLKVGYEVIMEGTKAFYNGLWQLGQDTVTGVKVVSRENEGQKPTPKDITEIAKVVTEDQYKHPLEAVQSTWVTALGTYKLEEGKHYIQIGANEYQFYNDAKYNGETLDEVKAAFATFQTGDIIRFTGISGIHYSNQFYAYEVAKSDETVTVSNEEKALLTLNAAQKNLETSYNVNKEVALYQSTDADVTVSYALNAEADTTVFALNNDTKTLTVSPKTTESVATLTISVTCGSVTKTADVELKACSELDILTIAEAIAIAETKDHNTYTEEKYYIKGTITGVSGKEENAYIYGNFVINDGANDFTVYGMYTVDGKVRYDAMNTKPIIGDEIIVYGQLGKYNSTLQMKNGWLYSLNGEVQEPQEVTPAPETPSTNIISLADAKAAADGTVVTVRGIVKSTDTWSEQHGNMSVTIVDEKLDDLYIYRLATKVAVGDDITVTGTMATYSNARQIGQGATAVINSSNNKIPGDGTLEVPENAITVTAQYTAGTTGNMTDGNNADKLGLDSNWSVVSDKNGNNNHVGLNKANNFRLYGNPTNILTFTYNGGQILSAKITFVSNAYSNVVVTVDGTAVTANDGIYTINSNSVVLTNGNADNTQVQITKIEFVVVPNA